MNSTATLDPKGTLRFRRNSARGSRDASSKCVVFDSQQHSLDSTGSQIEEAAERVLSESNYSPLSKVTCSVQGGRLMLKGTVPSYYLKQKAQELVRRVAGQLTVENCLHVPPIRGAFAFEVIR